MIKVLNEEEHAVRMLSEGFILKGSVGYELSLLAKYYIHRKGLNRPNTKNKLIEFCTEHIDKFDAVNWRNTLNRSVENGKKYNFINVDNIEITKSELDKIDELKSTRAAKLLFVLLVITKLSSKKRHMVNSLKKNPQNDSDKKERFFVNDSITSIVKLSKTNLKSDERYKILKQLQDKGFIKVTTKGKIEVLIVDNESEVVINVNRLDDFIYDYMEYTGVKIKKCEGEECNKRIVAKNNKIKYCKQCAAEEKVRKTVEKRNMLKIES